MTTVYRWVLSLYRRVGPDGKRVVKLPLEFLRRLFAKMGDPSYTVDIRGRRMSLPVSHMLPITVADYPLYDTLPTRVTDYLRGRDGRLIMVDVGANVGDTMLACSTGADGDRFLGVEAHAPFVRYLRINTADLKNCVLVEAYCHSGDDSDALVQFNANRGTARVIEVPDGLPLIKRTLDSILSDHDEFASLNFLKLDTDGNDFEILKGAIRSVAASRPVILMECDVFDNADYVADVVAAIGSLATAGYSRAIVYDQIGNYFSTFSTDDASPFLSAIAYQLVSDFGYFDLLFLQERDAAFIRNEKEFFLAYVEAEGRPSPSLRYLLDLEP